MATIAPDADLRRSCEEDTRAAWAAYLERLREVHGPAYERIEPEAWAELQAALASIERRRQLTLTALP